VGDFVKSDIYMNTFGHAVAEMVRIFLRIEAIEATRYKILPQKSSKKNYTGHPVTYRPMDQKHLFI